MDGVLRDARIRRFLFLRPPHAVRMVDFGRSRKVWLRYSLPQPAMLPLHTTFTPAASSIRIRPSISRVVDSATA